MVSFDNNPEKYNNPTMLKKLDDEVCCWRFGDVRSVAGSPGRPRNSRGNG